MPLVHVGWIKLDVGGRGGGGVLIGHMQFVTYKCLETIINNPEKL